MEKLLGQPAPAGPTRQAKELMRGWAAGYNAWLRQHRREEWRKRVLDFYRVAPDTALDLSESP
ncbi:hypothetical protein GCM10010359_02260 [Streptomyces morookaense]|nr:hypothetical protein GCM10010359_02260 [Streptomyces morookaense]